MIRRLVTSLLLSAAFAGVATPALAQVVVIVHPDSGVKALTAHQVSDLYLGRVRAIDGTPLQLLDIAGDASLRSRFFRAINGMDLARVNAYWARLQFSGNVLAPVPIANSEAIRDAVSRNRGAIGYINASEVTPQVRVVLALKD